LVLNFHGTGGSPGLHAQITEFEILGEEMGFLVASPEAKFPMKGDGRLTWNVDLHQDGVDDVLFVREMIRQISEEYAVDPKRIYATGWSGGGRMCSRLACSASDLVAAIGPVAGIRYPEDCNPSRPVPIITFHGRLDELNHYVHRADSSTYWRMGVEDAIAGWVVSNECMRAPSVDAVSATVDRVSYSNCREGGDIVFYRSDDAGHTWPGSPFANVMKEEWGLGITNDEIAATKLIWAFFESHPLQ
jgi:polyhydroxybutyrate depolymerase